MINIELVRVGVVVVVQNSEHEGIIRFSCDAGEWKGTEEEAIRRLRLIADDAGYEAFWNVFCKGEYVPEIDISEEENYKLYDNSLRQDRYQEAYEILVSETGYQRGEGQSWEDIYVFPHGGTWAVGYGKDESYYYVKLAEYD